MIAVIGAGPAGLALAWKLARSGHDVVVVEAEPRVGGLAGSRTVSGVRVDLGYHTLDPGMDPAIRTVIEELVELQERTRRGRLRLAGDWVPHPPRALGVLRAAGTATSARLLADAALTTFRRSRADSYASDLRARHGPTLWSEVHEPLAWKLWDTDPDHLASALARRRLPGDSTDLLGDAIRNTISSPTHLYPRRGFGAICDAMAELVPDMRLSTKVTGLIEHEDRVTVGLADGRIVTADRVFSTVPIGRTAVWLGLVQPAEVVLPVRAVVLVYLTVPRRPYTDADVHHLPDRTVLPSRVSEPTNLRDSAADPPDRTVLCAEIPCWEDDALWRSSDAELGRRVADDLVRSGLPDPRPTAVETVRLPAVYPVMTAASEAALDRAERAMDESERVVVLGRTGLFTPDHTHHALAMGLAAADQVRADGSFDCDGWRAARRRFDRFVVRV